VQTAAEFTRRSLRIYDTDPVNGNNRFQCLTPRWAVVNSVNDIHAFDDFAEGGETLLVRIAPAAEIEFRLVANAEEEIGCGSARFIPRHRDDPVCVANARLLRVLVRDARQAERMVVISQAALHHFDLELAIRLIIHSHHAVEDRFSKAVFFDVAQEVFYCDGRLLAEQLQKNIA
jgi:hypothetical protein